MATILDFQVEQFKLLLINKLPQYLLPSLESFGLSVKERKNKKDFQDGKHGGLLAFFVLHATYQSFG